MKLKIKEDKNYDIAKHLFSWINLINQQKNCKISRNIKIIIFDADTKEEIQQIKI